MYIYNEYCEDAIGRKWSLNNRHKTHFVLLEINFYNPWFLKFNYTEHVAMMIIVRQWEKKSQESLWISLSDMVRNLF